MSTLEQRITETLAIHRDDRLTPPSSGVRCICDWRSSFLPSFGGNRQHIEHIAAMVAPLLREAQAEALREAVSDFESHIGVGEFAELAQRGPLPWGHIEEAWDHQGPYMDWLRTRADKLATDE